MKIKTLIETPDGNYEFTAELSQMQHQFLIEYAVRDLMMKGLLPFSTLEEQSDLAKIAPNTSETEN